MEPNKEQKIIVDYFSNIQNKNRILLVEAPPGTGKTFTAVSASIEFVRTKLKQNPNYYKKVLILTFSKNARAQIEKQLDDLDEKKDGLNKFIEITNFHSFFQKYVWAYSTYLGIGENPVILSSIQRRRLLESKFSGISEYTGDDKQFEWAEALLEGEFYPRTPQGNIKPAVKKLIPFIEKIKQYILDLNKEGYIGFSDMGYHFNSLLNKSPQFLKTLQNKYEFLVLDEYQDASDLQDEIVNKLIGKENNAIFFADSKQMIYQWRGASDNRLDELQQKYNGQIELRGLVISERFKNKQDIANVIQNARLEQYDFLQNPSSENIKYITIKVSDKNLYNTQSKYKMYSNLKYKLIKDIPTYHNRKDKSTGILCRNNELVNYLRKALREDFKLSSNLLGNNEEEHNNIYKLIEFLEKEKSNITIDALSQELTEILFAVIYEDSIGSIQRNKIGEVKYSKYKNARTEILKGISNIIDKMDKSKNFADGLKQCFVLVKQSGLSINQENMALMKKVLQNKDISSKKVTDTFLQYQYLKSFKTLKGIYVLNVHQSKGREFDYVYIVDADSMSKDANLLYVALSRAKEKLFIYDWII